MAATISGHRRDLDHLIALALDDAVDRTYRLRSGRPFDEVSAHLSRELTSAGLDAHVLGGQLSACELRHLAQEIADGRRPGVPGAPARPR